MKVGMHTKKNEQTKSYTNFETICSSQNWTYLKDYLIFKKKSTNKLDKNKVLHLQLSLLFPDDIKKSDDITATQK